MTDLKQHDIGTSETQDLSFEKDVELRLMKGRIEKALQDQEVRANIASDFIHTFKQLGLKEEQATLVCAAIFSRLTSDQGLEQIEKGILANFEEIKIDDKSLVEILHEKLKDRAELIFSQIAPHLKEVKGKAIDYGAGDGQVTQKLHDDLGLDIEGVDVRPYKGANITVPMATFKGDKVGVASNHYEAAVLTNVLHHEKDNDKIIAELDRIVSKKLVIIETVPVGNSTDEIAKDKERTFMNDYLYNRLFHNADVPVPGTFETADGWINRFSAHGWKVMHSENLGEDQKTIKDTHHLLVFERA